MSKDSNPGLPSSVDGPVSYAIFELSRAHRAYAAELLRKLDLHPGQELILMHLHEKDGQTQSELIDRVGVDPSTMSKALRRMQLAGLLTRTPAEGDRRVSLNHLTDEGQALREPIAAMWRELEDVTTRNLTAQQSTWLSDVAHVIIDSINTRSSTEEPDKGETP